MYLGQLSKAIKKVFFVFLFIKVIIRSIKRYCFVRKYAVIPVQLEIFILQYTGWCVLIIWTFIFNQFSCLCQFLVDNFGNWQKQLNYYYYYYYYYGENRNVYCSEGSQAVPVRPSGKGSLEGVTIKYN